MAPRKKKILLARPDGRKIPKPTTQRPLLDGSTPTNVPTGPTVSPFDYDFDLHSAGSKLVGGTGRRAGGIEETRDNRFLAGAHNITTDTEIIPNSQLNM